MIIKTKSVMGCRDKKRPRLEAGSKNGLRIATRENTDILLQGRSVHRLA